jgi:hypothetical protein
MLKFIYLIAFILIAQHGFSQKKIESKNFSIEQKADWDAFIEYYSGNGNGTCMPIMETQIDSGKCTSFDFIADLYVGKTGRIYKVVVKKSTVICENKTIQKEVLECFISTLKEEWTVLKTFKGRIIKNASFQ